MNLRHGHKRAMLCPNQGMECLICESTFAHRLSHLGKHISTFAHPFSHLEEHISTPLEFSSRSDSDAACMHIVFLLCLVVALCSGAIRRHWFDSV